MGCSRGEWVLPAETAEAGEVRIGGAEVALVFDGKGGQMSVGGEVSSGSEGSKQVEEDGCVSLPRVEDAHLGLCEPGFDVGQCL